MNKEIELKARIESPDELMKRLTELYGSPSIISKDDVYYQYEGDFNEEGRQNVRLRREDGRNVVTVKRKKVNGGVEINDELEFSVDNADNFLSFLDLTGAKKWIIKTKKGWKFADLSGTQPVTVELCEVGSLGWFIEIEVVIESEDSELIGEAEHVIKKILHRLGVSENAIEPRFYSEMILEQS